MESRRFRGEDAEAKPPEMLSEHILFVDAEALVVDKPAGMPVDEPRDGTLGVANQLDLLRLGFQRAPQPVHRLDRDTSGCLLLARNPRAHRRFSEAFAAGMVEKRYLAVVDGTPSAVCGEASGALAKVSSREGGWRMIVDERKGRPASTRWRVLAEAPNGGALIEFRPREGRTHQIRVHAAELLGTPIRGDLRYGTANKGCRMLLHAWQLIVPRGAKPPVHAVAPPPGEIALLLPEGA